MDTVSSRTPDGLPNDCPVCGAAVRVWPSSPRGDAPCPACGTLLWFVQTSRGAWCFEKAAIGPLLSRTAVDSLDIVELIMELEEEFEMTIPDDQVEKIKTVGQAIAWLQEHQSH